MNVLHLVHQFLPDHIGGVELYTNHVAKDLVARGDQVAVFTRVDRVERGATWRAADGVTVIDASSGVLSPTQRFAMTFGNRVLHDAFAQALDRFRPDIVHIEHMMGQPVSIVQLLQARGIPYVVSLHDYWWFCANANLLTNDSRAACDGPAFAHTNCTRCVVSRSGQKAAWGVAPMIAGSLAWRARRLQQVLDGASALISPSRFVSEQYIEHNSSPRKIRLIPPGVKRPPAPELQVADTPKNLQTARPVRFFYLGGIAWPKGVHVALEAFRGIQGPAELWIAGRAPDDEGYRVQLQALASPDVRFLGALEHDKIWATLAQVDVVLVPSLWPETYNVVAREALVAGRPIFTSGLGALAETVENDMNGVQIPPGDVAAWRAAMQRVVDDPRQLAQIQIQARPGLTIAEHTDQVRALYGDVLML